MKKKLKVAYVISIALLVMVFLAVTGCTTGDDGGAAADVSDAPADAVDAEVDSEQSETELPVDSEVEEAATELSGSISIWSHMFAWEPVLEDMVAAFNVHHPNVDVEIVINGGGEAAIYYTLLGTAIQAGTAPDLFWTNGTPTPHMGDFVAENAILDLTGIIDVSHLDEGALALGRIGDGLYSVPWMAVDTRTVYYNIDIFEAQGLQVPQTFDEFEALLGQLSEAGYIPISLSPNSPWTLLFAFEPILSAMYPEFTRGLADYSVLPSDAPARSALSRMVEWGERGYFGRHFLGVTDGDAQLLAFTFGDAAMMIDGTWMTLAIQDNNPNLNLGAFQIPSNAGTRGMVGTFSNGFSIYQNSRNMDASIAFLQFMASIEGQTIWVQGTGSVSGSRYIEVDSDIIRQISDADEVLTSWHFVLSEYAVEPGAAVNIWNQDFTRVFSGDITVDEMMDAIEAVMR